MQTRTPASLHRMAIGLVLAFLGTGFPLAGLDKPIVQARAAVLLDFDTGKVLFEKGADASIPPASLTKLVTIFLTGSAVQSGRFSLETPVNISRNAWAATMPDSSLMFLEPGQRVTVGELLRGLAVVSGNDAAVALAEHIAGSEREFAELMNSTMKGLGFTTMHFVDASGFDGRNMVTAREFAEFCRLYIRQFPGNLQSLHSVREMTYPLPENMPIDRRSRTKPIHQFNRNTLLWEDAEVDGLKTGFVNEAGYNFAVTAKRGEMRLVLVTLGGPGRTPSEGARIRGEDGIRLLSYGFDNFTHYRPRPPEFLPVKVWKGSSRSTVPVAAIPELLTIPRAAEARLSVRILQRTELTAPVKKGDVLGEITYLDGLTPLYSFELKAAADVRRGGVITRAWHSLQLFFRGLSGARTEPYRNYSPKPAGT